MKVPDANGWFRQQFAGHTRCFVSDILPVVEVGSHEVVVVVQILVGLSDVGDVGHKVVVLCVVVDEDWCGTTRYHRRLVSVYATFGTVPFSSGNESVFQVKFGFNPSGDKHQFTNLCGRTAEPDHQCGLSQGGELFLCSFTCHRSMLFSNSTSVKCLSLRNLRASQHVRAVVGLVGASRVRPVGEVECERDGVPGHREGADHEAGDHRPQHRHQQLRDRHLDTARTESELEVGVMRDTCVF